MADNNRNIEFPFIENLQFYENQSGEDDMDGAISDGSISESELLPHDVHTEQSGQVDFDPPLDSVQSFCSYEQEGISVDCPANKNLTNQQRWAIYTALLERSVDGKLKKNTTTEVASLFSVPRSRVQRIWTEVKKIPPGVEVDVSSKKARNCGRKQVQIDVNSISSIPLHKRTTLRTLSKALNVSLGVLHRQLKKGLLRRHSNAVKPQLRGENMVTRLKFCLSMLEQQSLPHAPKFVDMQNIVHIDEKWFYMTKKSETYYLHPGEVEPLRTCQNKNYIEKIMFLAAVARPRFDDEGNELFSGKIGVFPLVFQQAAQRRSRNRKAGTIVTKPITSVTREIIRACLVEQVVPAIKAKWPRDASMNTIYVQQDNARTHINPNDEEFQRAASEDGFDIKIICQPPNSPDLNVLDLGFFSAIQSLQHKECPRTIDDLIMVVQKAFDEYPATKINHIFLTLQSCMVEIMKANGSNRYKIPHMSKNALEREGCLPQQITCEASLVEEIMNIVRS